MTMPEEHLHERSLRVALESGMFSVPDPASLSNIRAFVDALRTATKGSDIPASDEGIRAILERTCGQFNLRIEPKETIGLVGPTRRHRVKRVFLLRAGFGAIGLLFLDPPAEWSLLLPDDGATPAPVPGRRSFLSNLFALVRDRGTDKPGDGAYCPGGEQRQDDAATQDQKGDGRGDEHHVLPGL
jgi:hypothetical protein